jgi:phospholipid-transporting ATPase
MVSIQEHDIPNIRGSIICELPNSYIYKFEGQAHFDYNNDAIPLGPDNIMLRGMSLRNTEYVYGVVIFTGHETKIMKNNSDAKYKFSKLEKLLNRSVFIIFLV